MRARRIVLVVVGLVAALAASAAWLSPPAVACQASKPPTVENIAADPRYVGVYEQEHVARVPAMVLRGARSISVVTRYWGEPPPSRGLHWHGEATLHDAFVRSDYCYPNDSAQVGTTEYRVSLGDPKPPYRGEVELGESGDWDTTGILSPDQEAALTAHFGRPTVVAAGSDRQFEAYMALLWQPALFLGIPIVAAAALLVRRRNRREHAELAPPDSV